MAKEARVFFHRPLDPIDRISEVLFGLIMVLTFTCSLSVAEAGRDEIRTMLIGALGCNLAWGIIDAVFYLMGCFSSQGRGILQLKAVRTLSDAGAAHRVICRRVAAPGGIGIVSSRVRRDSTEVESTARATRAPKARPESVAGCFRCVLNRICVSASRGASIHVR